MAAGRAYLVAGRDDPRSRRDPPADRLVEPDVDEVVVAA
jgi:hypothetical protein